MQTLFRRQRLAVVVLPLILGGYWFYADFIEPGPFYINYDPELPYMLSSLSIFKGYSYVFVDHPGTPVEVLGSIILALTYPITMWHSDSFPIYHLTHPELFLILGRALLTAGSIACAVLLASYSIKIENWLHVLFCVAISVCFYAVHPLSFASLVLWSHNSFNFPAGTLLLLTLLVLLRPGRELFWWQVFTIGFGAGILAAVQLYFVTWIIGAAVAVFTLYVLQKRGWPQTILASLNIGIASILGFVVATLPIIAQYGRLIDWVFRILFHQGSYGTGETGFTSPEQFWSNFTSLWSELKILFVAIFLIVAMLFVAIFLQIRNREHYQGLLAVAAGLLVQLIVTVVIIIKHPLPIYMLAVAAILPILLAIGFSMLGSYNSVSRFVCTTLSIVILVGFGYNLIMSFMRYNDRVHLLQSAQTQTDLYIANYAASIGRNRSSLTVLWTYETYSDCYALHFGNAFTSYAFLKEISSICSNQLDFNIWGKRAVRPDGHRIALDEPGNWDILVTSQRMLTVAPYLASYGKVIVSQGEAAPDNHVVFVLPR
jgi:hypothetical protein